MIQEDRATLDTDHKRDPSHLLLHTNGAAAVESSNVTKFMKRLFAPLNAGNIGTTVLRKALATEAAKGNAATIDAMRQRLKNSLTVFFRHYVHATPAHEPGLEYGANAADIVQDNMAGGGATAAVPVEAEGE